MLKFYHLDFNLTKDNNIKKIVICKYDKQYTITYHKINKNGQMYSIYRKYNVDTLFKTLVMLRKDKNFKELTEF